MTILPSHIEMYLKDAGLTGTEVLILSRLMTEQSLSLPGLAMKTGKAAGALSGSMKRLLSRHMIRQQTINGQKHFSCGSMAQIEKWIQSDIRRKHEDLQRRQQDMTSYFRTLSRASSRPLIETYHGDDGLKLCLQTMVDAGTDSIVHVLPDAALQQYAATQELRTYFDSCRRTAQRYVRLLTHHTAQGRRLQSDDHLRLRTTALVDESACSFVCEKMIADSVMYLFDWPNMQVSAIRHHDLAAHELQEFEWMWQEATAGAPSTYSQTEPAA